MFASMELAVLFLCISYHACKILTGLSSITITINKFAAETDSCSSLYQS